MLRERPEKNFQRIIGFEKNKAICFKAPFALKIRSQKPAATIEVAFVPVDPGGEIDRAPSERGEFNVGIAATAPSAVYRIVRYVSDFNGANLYESAGLRRARIKSRIMIDKKRAVKRFASGRYGALT